jgi:predicted DNA-binding transcriptional regulator AlpA
MTAELQNLSDRLDRIERAALLGAKEVLTVDEAALFTGYSVKSIYSFTSSRGIPFCKNEYGKLYFIKSDLVEWMTRNRHMTADEINSRADTYVALHPAKATTRKAPTRKAVATA